MRGWTSPSSGSSWQRPAPSSQAPRRAGSASLRSSISCTHGTTWPPSTRGKNSSHPVLTRRSSSSRNTFTFFHTQRQVSISVQKTEQGLHSLELFLSFAISDDWWQHHESSANKVKEEVLTFLYYIYIYIYIYPGRGKLPLRLKAPL